MLPSSLTDLQGNMRACQRCVSHGHPVVPPAVFSGNDRAKVMLIGQAPGVTEVTAKRPFNAGSGRRLFDWLADAGWQESEFRSLHYMTAVTKCYPGKANNGKGDRVPSRDEQALCRPFLDAEYALLKPRLILPVGGLAIRLFWPASTRLKDVIGTGIYFRPEEVPDGLGRRISTAASLTAFDPMLDPAGQWIVPLPHPSGASLWPNHPANRQLIQQAIALLAGIRRCL